MAQAYPLPWPQASPEAALGINAIGIIDAAAWGFGVGIVGGPVAGAVTGVAVTA